MTLPPEAASDLAVLRSQIDAVDAQMITLLGKRFELTRRIGRLKADSSLPSKDNVREAEQTLRRGRLAESVEVDRNLVVRLFDLITRFVVTEHEVIATQTEAN